MEESGEEEGSEYFPVKGAAGAVCIRRPYYAVAVGIEEGAMLLEDLFGFLSQKSLQHAHGMY